jgi:hypothetical protein
MAELGKAVKPAGKLYEQDFAQWAEHNAALLREGRYEDADIEHIVEELEEMGRSERGEAWSRLRVLLLHLAKWQIQPERRETSTWKSTILTQRRELQRLLKFSPSVKRYMAEIRQEVYEAALYDAAVETGLPTDSLPRKCPFTLEELLDAGHLP